MKNHNKDYEGKIFSVEVTSNGFILSNNNMMFTRWKKIQCTTFEILIAELASNIGLLQIGETISEVRTNK